MPIELPPGTAAYSDRSEPPKNRQLLVLLGLAIALIAALIWSIGALTNTLVWVIPPSVEQRLGALIVPAFEQQAKPSPAQDTLNQLMDRLEAKLPDEQRQGREYKVLYIPDKTVNALAIPGERIIIYAGLLDQMQSENELMMVMGHELGHFAHRDHLRGLGRGLVIQLAFTVFLGDPGSLSSIAVSGLAALSKAQFSQTQEKEADEFGLTLLNSTYGQVAGATDFFARMSQKENSNFAMLNTHPPSRDRITALDQLIRDRGYRLGQRSPLPEPLQ